MKLTLVLCCIVFLAALHHGNAIRCYLCDSATKKNCEDPFDKEGIDIQDNMGTCIKIKGERSGDQVVVRAGSPLSVGKSDCESETRDGVKGTGCYCDSDLCNAATTTWTSLVVLVICVIFAKAFF